MRGRANQHPAIKKDGAQYTIRKGGKVVVSSDLVDCGYSADELKELQKAGFILYADGKRVKR